MSCRVLARRVPTLFSEEPRAAAKPFAPSDWFWPAGGGLSASGYERSALILTKDDDAGENLPELLTDCGLAPVRLASVGELRTGAIDARAALVLCEDSLPDGDFRDALRIVTTAVRRIPLIVFSRFADWDTYLKAVRLGAHDCLRYPFRTGELRWILGRMFGPCAPGI